MEPNDYFVGIYDPVDVRRNILESSKEIIKALQSFESIENIREEKLKLYKEMRHKMNEIDLLVSKLKTRLPQSHLRKASAEKKKTTAKSQNVSNELEKLESELLQIEKELSSLK